MEAETQLKDNEPYQVKRTKTTVSTPIKMASASLGLCVRCIFQSKIRRLSTGI